jgi:adenylate cyclase
MRCGPWLCSIAAASCYFHSLTSAAVFDIAFHNSTQHQQFRHDGDSMVLAIDAAGKWHRAVEACIQPTEPLIEIWETDASVRVRMTGIEERIAVDGDTVSSTGESELTLPAAFSIGDTRFEIAPVDSKRRRRLRPLGSDGSRAAGQHTGGRGPGPETLTRWLEALAALHRWIASSPEFYAEAARFVVDPIGLDGGIVLRRRDAQWEIVASHLPNPELGIRFERSVVDQLLDSPQTWLDGNQRPGGRRRMRVLRDTDQLQSRIEELQNADAVCEGSSDEPLHARQAVVVAPLFDASGAVTGAVYGFRAVHRRNGRQNIRHLEARLVDVLAGSVSAGLARLEREAAAARQRALFEHAFSPAVVERLEHDPTILGGREREVTVLFADLRNFSSICAALPTRESYQLLNDVMEHLTTAVMEFDGVVIDYYGDGLAAMWNAPVDQPGHAELACRAGLRMLETLPNVCQVWRERLARELRVGIGVHTGPATVGNVGSPQRLKYGPRGVTVNLAARVESATKRLRLPMLVTRATAERLTDRLRNYRVCQAQLRGIAEPVDLFAVAPTSDARQTLRDLDRYQQALAHYEAGRLDEAERLLAGSRSTDEAVPIRFLSEEIESRRHRQLGRRESDVVADPRGPTIVLDSR